MNLDLQLALRIKNREIGDKPYFRLFTNNFDDIMQLKYANPYNRVRLNEQIRDEPIEKIQTG